MKKILIIDDDRELQSLLREYLNEYNFEVIQSFDGLKALPLIKEKKPRLVILDIMLPHKDGFEILREIRHVSSTPVLMLTARGDDTDRILGLELGADDYLCKPFNPRELLARIKAVLRRSDGKTFSGPEHPALYVSGKLGLNLKTFTIICGEKEAELSSTEFRLMEAFFKHHDTVLSRDELLNIARGRDFVAFDRSVDMHVSRLRAKIAEISGEEKLIKTIWGAGYMYVEKG